MGLAGHYQYDSRVWCPESRNRSVISCLRQAWLLISLGHQVSAAEAAPNVRGTEIALMFRLALDD